MLVEFAYTLQINLNKDNLDAIDSAARKLGFLDIEEMCKQVVGGKNNTCSTIIVTATNKINPWKVYFLLAQWDEISTIEA